MQNNFHKFRTMFNPTSILFPFLPSLPSFISYLLFSFSFLPLGMTIFLFSLSFFSTLFYYLSSYRFNLGFLLFSSFAFPFLPSAHSLSYHHLSPITSFLPPPFFSLHSFYPFNPLPVPSISSLHITFRREMMARKART